MIHDNIFISPLKGWNSPWDITILIQIGRNENKSIGIYLSKKTKKLSLHISILVSAEIFAQLNRFLLPQLQKTTEEMFKKLCVENRLQLGQCAWIAEMWNKKKNPEGVFSFETAAPQHF